MMEIARSNENSGRFQGLMMQKIKMKLSIGNCKQNVGDSATKNPTMCAEVYKHSTTLY